jgi:tetratricopeptide (TPR) repeat protein
MKSEKIPNDHMTMLSQELLAYCMEKQGRGEEALSCISDRTDKAYPPERSLFLGSLFAQQGKWDNALLYLSQLTKLNGLKDKVKCLGSDGLLRAAIHFSDEKDWNKTIECLSMAQMVWPENPALKYIPANMESDLPIVFFKAGAYEKAIEFWERDLNNGHLSPKTIHLLAIGNQCMIENGCESTLECSLKFLRQAHMYWTALSHAENYWANVFEKRSVVYGKEISLNGFLSVTSTAGITLCENRLNQLQRKMESENDTESLQILTEVRTSLGVEYHSAKLLSQICHSKKFDWPGGGLRMLTSLWDAEKCERELLQIESNEIGSDGWLLKGLINTQSCSHFLYFLNGDYVACMHSTDQSQNEDLRNLMGLSLIRRAETALESKHTQGCQDIVDRLSRIPDTSLRNKAQGLLEKMVSRRLKTYLGRGQQDQGIKFLEDILKKVQLTQASDSLSSLLLKRGKTLCLDGDIDGFLQDYERALYYARDTSTCEKEFKNIVMAYLNKLFEKKDFKTIESCIERLKSKYPKMPFLSAMPILFNALKKVKKGRNIGDKSIVKLLEDAYNADSKDKTIVNIYSDALTERAIKNINDVNDGYASYDRLRNAMRESETLFLKALKINPTNQNTRKNLRLLVIMMRKAGISPSPETIKYL